MPDPKDDFDISDFEPLDTSDFEPIPEGQITADMAAGILPPPAPQQQPSFFGRLTEPLTDWPSRFMREHYNPAGMTPRWANELVGDIASGLTSPLNIGLTAATGGTNLAARAGFPLVAKGLNTITRGLAGAQTAEGANDVANAPDLTGKLFGGLEMLGGGLGMRYGAGLRPKKIQQTTTNVPPVQAAPNTLGPANTIMPKVEATPAFELMSPDDYKVYQNALDKYQETAATFKPGTPEYDAAYEELQIQASWLSQKLNKKAKTFWESANSAVPVPTAPAGGSGAPPTVPPATGAPPAPITPSSGPIPPAITRNKPTITRELYELGRGTSAAWDISAPFRQGIGMVGTGKWFKAWIPMFKSLGSERAYIEVTNKWKALPHIQSKLADDAGLALTDLNKKLTRREELLQSTWAEKVPGIRASNRAYTAFLNDLRAHTFNSLVEDAIAMGIDKNNLPYMRAIANFVNDATGRGRFELGFHVPTGKFDITTGTTPKIGKSINYDDARVFNDIFFSPRLMASRVRMLNPGTYIALPPQVRRQYLYSLTRMGGAWLTFATMGKMMGGDVSMDPTSADFGKIRFGNTRIDPAGGFQQYLVLATRMASGRFTSSTSENSPTRTLGASYKARTRGEVERDFLSNKLHPTQRFAYDLLHASKYKPFNVADRTAQMFVPMVAGDLIQLAKEKPELAALVLPASIGMGAQTYEKNQEKSAIIPNEWDIRFEGGPLQDIYFGRQQGPG